MKKICIFSWYTIFPGVKQAKIWRRERRIWGSRRQDKEEEKEEGDEEEDKEKEDKKEEDEEKDEHDSEEPIRGWCATTQKE